MWLSPFPLLSCALLPWWKLACEKSIKDEFTTKDEFIIDDEIATKVCSNRPQCGMGHPSPCSSCCHLFAAVLLPVWVATPILEFDSELPSGWESPRTIYPVFHAFCWIGGPASNFPLYMANSFTAWARWRVALFGFSQPLLGLAIYQGQKTSKFSRCSYQLLLTRGGRQRLTGRPRPPLPVVQLTSMIFALAHLAWLLLLLRWRISMINSRPFCCKWSRTPPCVRGILDNLNDLLLSLMFYLLLGLWENPP